LGSDTDFLAVALQEQFDVLLSRLMSSERLFFMLGVVELARI